ncbi:MAG: hypothetical protein K9L75_04855 [Spirochaetia bacterium]|nr:hypothetical protein [Spirochaetia bacterium]
MDNIGPKVRLHAQKQKQNDPYFLEKRLRSVRINYDSHLRLDSEGKKKANMLFHILYEGKSYRDKNQKLLNMEVLIANLINNKKRYFAISLNRNHWVRNQYRKTSVNTIELVKMLSNRGYIEMHKGKGNEDPKLAYDTKIKATEKLLSYFQILPEQVEYEHVLVEVRESGSEKLLPYKETLKIKKIKSVLKKANRVNANADIRHNEGHILHTSLTAIFRDKTTLYGRLHTKGFYHYQGLNGEERSEITINGVPVVEWDYHALHPYMLYAKEGIQIWQDPYVVILPESEQEVRGFLKESFLPLINTSGKWTKPKHGQKPYWRTSRRNTASEITQRLYLDKYIYKKAKNEGRQLRKKELEKVLETKLVRRKLKEKGINDAEQLIDAFIESHRPIAHYFCTEKKVGKRLMNLDAQIALDVVGHFVKKDIPILAIHDSFVVQETYQNELYQVMRWAYKKHNNGFRIKLK